MATHSSILAWKIPWTEKPGGLQSVGSQESTWQRNHHHHVYSVSVFSLNEYFSLPLVLSNLMCIHVILLTFLKFGFFELLRSVSFHCIWNAFHSLFLETCFLFPTSFKDSSYTYFQLTEVPTLILCSFLSVSFVSLCRV